MARRVHISIVRAPFVCNGAQRFPARRVYGWERGGGTKTRRNKRFTSADGSSLADERRRERINKARDRSRACESNGSSRNTVSLISLHRSPFSLNNEPGDIARDARFELTWQSRFRKLDESLAKRSRDVIDRRLFLFRNWLSRIPELSHDLVCIYCHILLIIFEQKRYIVFFQHSSSRYSNVHRYDYQGVTTCTFERVYSCFNRG